MPTPVKIIEWEPTWEMSLHELDGLMFDVPVVGSPYWRGNVAMRVRQIEDGDLVRVHLERDAERQRDVLAGLPDGGAIECGRNSDTGMWQAAVEKDGQIIGTAIGDDCDTVVRDAIAVAAARG
jgi:hypothetical protein